MHLEKNPSGPWEIFLLYFLVCLFILDFVSRVVKNFQNVQEVALIKSEGKL